MIRKASAICAILLLCACGSGSRGNGTTSPATVQALVSSNVDKLKYVGSWSSCMPQANGQFSRNNISFSSDGGDLVFIPAIGIVGSFYDSTCTQAVPGEAVGVNPIAGLRFSSIKTITIAPQSNSRFDGTADELPDLGDPAFKLLALALTTRPSGSHRRARSMVLSCATTRNKLVGRQWVDGRFVA
jgi:hypothetical protein